MFKKLYIRALCLSLMLIVALTAGAQRPQVTDRLNRSGQVTVDAPKELAKRNNADIGKQQSSGSKDKKLKEKDKKKADPKSEEEKLNELDDEDTNAKKEEDKKPERRACSSLNNDFGRRPAPAQNRPAPAPAPSPANNGDINDIDAIFSIFKK